MPSDPASSQVTDWGQFSALGWLSSCRFVSAPSPNASPSQQLLAHSFVYEVQQGRLGIVFGSNAAGQPHSVVISSLERSILVVDKIDFTKGSDRWRVLSFDAAKSDRSAHRMLSAAISVEVEQATLRKLHQSTQLPGCALGACRPRRGDGGLELSDFDQTGVSGFEDVDRLRRRPFVYVRWVESSAAVADAPDDSALAAAAAALDYTAVLLSNGRCQIGLRDSELRFRDARDIYRVARSTGACEPFASLSPSAQATYGALLKRLFAGIPR